MPASQRTLLAPVFVDNNTRISSLPAKHGDSQLMQNNDMGGTSQEIVAGIKICWCLQYRFYGSNAC
jgi:hypothetical protein